MASEGIVTVGNQVVGYSERNCYCYWDINPDLTSNRDTVIEEPFYRLENYRYCIYNEIDHIYMTRWAYLVRAYAPITERHIKFNFKKVWYSNRIIYYYLDTRERLAFTEGLLTQTPLILKYPKYYNWNYIPQVINPEFYVWSYYKLDESSIILKVVSSSSTSITINSGLNPDKFKIEKVSKYMYKVRCYIEHIFEQGDQVSIYVSLNDEKGNYLKPGLW